VTVADIEHDAGSDRKECIDARNEKCPPKRE
jgi:hypothetical protein